MKEGRKVRNKVIVTFCEFLAMEKLCLCVCSELWRNQGSFIYFILIILILIIVPFCASEAMGKLCFFVSQAENEEKAGNAEWKKNENQRSTVQR